MNGDVERGNLGSDAGQQSPDAASLGEAQAQNIVQAAIYRLDDLAQAPQLVTPLMTFSTGRFVIGRRVG